LRELLGYNLSIAVAVGFITLAGVARRGPSRAELARAIE
jgi:Cu/Ag efflux pump CusA